MAERESKEEKKPANHALGETIVKLRKKLGFSQAQLATEGGLSQGYLSQIENGDVKSPSYKTAIALAKALGESLYIFDTGFDPTHVFLRPEAKNIEGLLESGSLPGHKINAIITIVEHFTPQIKEVELTYLSINRFLSPKKFGKKVRGGRNKLDQLQGAVAPKLGISQGYLSQVENGNTGSKAPEFSPPLELVTSISETLEIDLYELMNLSKEHYNPQVEKLDQFLWSEDVDEESKKNT